MISETLWTNTDQSRYLLVPGETTTNGEINEFLSGGTAFEWKYSLQVEDGGGLWQAVNSLYSKFVVVFRANQ
jgi:hypothetical protein